MARMRSLVLGVAVAMAIAAGMVLLGGSTASGGGGYEVWLVDQSDSVADGGGRMHIFRGAALEADAADAGAEVVDLGAETRSLCLAQTGSAPRRPHMLMFNTPESHAVLAFVATGHVVFFDASDRRPLACIDVGAQAHAAVPTRNGKSVIVANQNGKLLQRIATNYARDRFTLDNGATINLATCTTPSGAACEDPALRPDNAPICPLPDQSSRLVFVTLRGGGMFVVDPRSTPMRIVAEYDRATVHPNGCGGLEADRKMFVNSGGGTAANLSEFDVYAFALRKFRKAPSPPNTPAPTVVVSEDDRDADSHGLILTKRGHYGWVTDRTGNRIVVIDPERETKVSEFSLLGPLSNDPTADLLDVSRNGRYVLASLRGPTPLTADPHASAGSTPGVGVIRVDRVGRSGKLVGIARISNVVGGVELADPHAIAVRHR
jgi:DNA-binding beta-propeller fold protein YncE